RKFVKKRKRLKIVDKLWALHGGASVLRSRLLQRLQRRHKVLALYREGMLQTLTRAQIIPADSCASRARWDVIFVVKVVEKPHAAAHAPRIIMELRRFAWAR